MRKIDRRIIAYAIVLLLELQTYLLWEITRGKASQELQQSIEFQEEFRKEILPQWVEEEEL